MIAGCCMMPMPPRPVWKIWFDTLPDPSVASHATIGAMCCGPPASSSLLATVSPRASRSGMVMRVSAPGEMVLTVQPYFASSSASTRVKPAMPAFAAP